MQPKILKEEKIESQKSTNLRMNFKIQNLMHFQNKETRHKVKKNSKTTIILIEENQDLNLDNKIT